MRPTQEHLLRLKALYYLRHHGGNLAPGGDRGMSRAGSRRGHGHCGRQQGILQTHRGFVSREARRAHHAGATHLCDTAGTGGLGAAAARVASWWSNLDAPGKRRRDDGTGTVSPGRWTWSIVTGGWFRRRGVLSWSIRVNWRSSKRTPMPRPSQEAGPVAKHRRRIAARRFACAPDAEAAITDYAGRGQGRRGAGHGRGSITPCAIASPRRRGAPAAPAGAACEDRAATDRDLLSPGGRGGGAGQSTRRKRGTPLPPSRRCSKRHRACTSSAIGARGTLYHLTG